MQQQKEVPLLFYSSTNVEEDKSLLKVLENHLGTLKQNGVISEWHKGMIGPGMEWAKQIEDYLNSAAIILLLISPDFLASDYRAGIEEVTRAMKRHEQGEARVIPILLRPVVWDNTPFAKLQPLPSNRRFVTQWADKDAAFLDITEGIRRVVEDITTPKPPPPREPSRAMRDNPKQATEAIALSPPGVIREQGNHNQTNLMKEPKPPGNAATSKQRQFPSLHVTRRDLLTAGITLTAISGGEASYHFLTQPFYQAPLQTYTGHSAAVQTIAWSPDGKYIASAGKDTYVQVWLADTAKGFYQYSGHTGTVRRVAWSPDGKYIASAGDDRVVRIWTPLSGEDYTVYRLHTDQVHGIAWSPKNSQAIASASYDKTVRVWHITTKKDLVPTYISPDRVESIAWSPNGQWIAAAADDGMVHLLNAQNGKQHYPYDLNQGLATYSVAWSPDGTQLTSASADQTVRIWEQAQNTAKQTFTGYNNSVWAAAWSPDGEYILSASKDQTVQVWDVNTSNRVFLYKGDTGSFMTSVAWHPDKGSKRFAVGSIDSKVRIWSL
jgi:WD40 repeat protein